MDQMIDPASGPAITHAFFDRARGRLTLDVPAGLTDPNVPVTRGDLDLDPSLWERAGVAATRPAAVLVPVVDRPEPSVILTMRTPDLSSHAGQIAFPGGKIDKADKGPLAAALREAKEEIGLDARLVDPLGYLDLYLTFSGYRILPTDWIAVHFGYSRQTLTMSRYARACAASDSGVESFSLTSSSVIWI